MSKADEMFEELGYKKEDDEYWIIYKGEEKDITFNKKYKNVEVYDERESQYMTMRELQAINEKCKELGWLDVK